MNIDAGKISIGKNQGDARLCHKLLEFSQISRQGVESAKQPGFMEEQRVPLEQLVTVDEFQRMGSFLEVMRWKEYIEFMSVRGGYISNTQNAVLLVR